ncbi:FAD-binding oxidoreductase [Shinella sp. PSBB067]|uniref:NAD(P)/FAD-dependent oxidoreductase n=1 Tax=Shinella sp. PSBB067 TaxID=2715959 RepID=UPI00193B07AB|nr:FAD-dependent oxidoreductase [Shinella sp. PSBB067]QRI62541.1 FAD-binding oxidoreductase [Shinella sp. PSBB067]
MMPSRTVHDIVVVGGGLVGTATAIGLRRQGLSVLILDGEDDDHRASRGNFGLVWVQTKGHKVRPYAELSREASRCWPEFALYLKDLTGIDVGLEDRGAFYLCLSEEEFEARRALMARQFDADLPVPGAYEMLARPELDRAMPGLGPLVFGACYGRQDGAVNPLLLLRAVNAAFVAEGGEYRNSHTVTGIRRSGGGFEVATAHSTHSCGKLVLAAGLGNNRLGAMVDISMDVRPVRGQILVTSKLPRMLHFPTHTIRQMPEGGFILGDSREEVGFDSGTTPEVMAAIARKAIGCFPGLACAQLLRVWGGLRTFTDDGVPRYLRSPTHAGAFALNVHSGVTLAPLHASILAKAIADDDLEARLPHFSRSRA